MPIVLDGTQGIQTPMYGGAIANNAVTPVVGMKNRIINGACVIDQRNAGASFTPTNGGYGLDRWKYTLSQASKLTSQQSTTAPVGFNNALLITSSSAYSIVSGDYFAVYQNIEGFNFADCGFGTANAKTVTLSFWVRSSLTGTFGGSLTNSAQDRCYPFSYTISSADTYEYKTVTIAGDTTGTWVGATNGTGASVWFGLGVGSTYSGTAGAWNSNSFNISATGATSVVGTNGATFYITGVQLEVGSTATSFDYRPYGTELALCQRYYEQILGTASQGYFNNFFAYNTTDVRSVFTYKVTKRAAPTCTFSGSLTVSNSSKSANITSFSFDAPTPDAVLMYNASQSGFTTGQGLQGQMTTASTATLSFSSEL